MGCGLSSTADTGKARVNEDPELMGKAKFLSCPALTEVTDPSQTKWLLIVFAPLTHHGLIFAARNAKDGSLLVKDIVDKQVTKEKEEQKVQLSYNLFFKAISTEVAKAGRSGAKVDWHADGSVTVECKIAISGSASSNKKPDTYTAVLRPVEATEEHLFKYVAEPLATHYCKKRTDGWNLDRPDPHKEKLYGEQEANAIMRAASMRASQKVLDQELPNIASLRAEHAAARVARDAAVAKVNTLKQMLLTRSIEPPLLRLPPDDAFAPCELLKSGANVVALSQEAHVTHPAIKDLHATMNAPAEPPTDSAAPADLDSLTAFKAPDAQPLYRTALAAFRALDLVGDGTEQIHEANLQRFLLRIETLHRPSNAFHNATRAAERVQAFYAMLVAARSSGFRPSPRSLRTAMVAATVHDADHCGLNNAQGLRSAVGGYIPTLYSFESHVERHSLAVGLCEARVAEVPVDRDGVAAVVLATDLAKHQDFMARFLRRVKEVADYSRRPDDEALVFGALLKAADMCHFFHGRDQCDAAVKDLALELAHGNALSGLPPNPPSLDTRLFVAHVAAPLLAAVGEAFPSLAGLAEACGRNCS